ncbi:MAG TPA: VTT domain-containing protein [Anaerolineaceae bacterium]|nr:VTT domain-containing protein [Anaerolineaceae bacterium]
MNSVDPDQSGNIAAPRQSRLSGWKLTLARIAALLFVIGITITIFIFRTQVHQLQMLGYPGIFLVSLLSNATIILPVPGVLFTSLMGAVFNPVLVALAAASGATLGELSGFLAGFSGQAVAEKTKAYQRIEPWMQRYGHWTILVLAFVPNPFFDIGGMVAGAMKMPVWRFLLFCWIGKFGKMLLFAYGGASIFGFFSSE